MTAICQGTIVTDGSGVPACLDQQSAPLAWIQQAPFDPNLVDPAVASMAFAAGFMIVGISWALGRGVRAVLDLIRR